MLKVQGRWLVPVSTWVTKGFPINLPKRYIMLNMVWLTWIMWSRIHLRERGSEIPLNCCNGSMIISLISRCVTEVCRITTVADTNQSQKNPLLIMMICLCSVNWGLPRIGRKYDIMYCWMNCFKNKKKEKIVDD